MFIRLNRRTAQSTGEYAILIGLVIAAVVAMQVYVKRGLQGQLKDAMDTFSTTANFTSSPTKQYEPYYLASNFEVTRDSKVAETLGTDNVGKAGVYKRIIDNTGDTVSRGVGGYQEYKKYTNTTE